MKALLKLARQSIEEEFDSSKQCDLEPYKGMYNEHKGAFVTLRIQSMLRGCIGTIIATQPLYQTVYDMAKKAAFQDHRFQALDHAELEKISIEISVLSELQRVQSAQDIRLGTHGIILNYNTASAVFLPEVAIEQGWDKQSCLEHLSLKAGLDKNAWKTASFDVFTSDHVSEASKGTSTF